jgi:hypothetical protein
MRACWVSATIVSGMLLGWVSTAHADAIDGRWCHPDGRRLTIRGRDIVTPGGMHMQGDYTRHSFAYVVPSGEPGPGETVSMVLLSEYLMHSRQGDSEAPVQAWNRCPPDISALRPKQGFRPEGAL